MADNLIVESYVARRTLKVGDRTVQPGEPVPEAEHWRRPESWVNAGYLAVTFRSLTDEEQAVIDAQAAGAALADEDPADLADALAELNMPDLRALAKERGLKGYSKLKKDALLELLA